MKTYRNTTKIFPSLWRLCRIGWYTLGIVWLGVCITLCKRCHPQSFNRPKAVRRVLHLYLHLVELQHPPAFGHATAIMIKENVLLSQAATLARKGVQLEDPTGLSHFSLARLTYLGHGGIKQDMLRGIVLQEEGIAVRKKNGIHRGRGMLTLAAMRNPHLSRGITAEEQQVLVRHAKKTGVYHPEAARQHLEEARTYGRNLPGVLEMELLAHATLKEVARNNRPAAHLQQRRTPLV